MDYGVIIRSIGERTENLCYQSVALYIPPENIHFIRNQSPSYNAYLAMFKLARRFKYNWFLALDADVVLKNNWGDLIFSNLHFFKAGRFYEISFLVHDYITNSRLSRGVHFYNNEFNDNFINYMRFNKLLANSLFLKKLFNHRYTSKPESSLELHLGRSGILKKNISSCIGFHGYEQYYKEIFRQYSVRFSRDRNFANSHASFILNEDSCLLKINNMDRYVSKLGWEFAKKNVLSGNINEIYDRISAILALQGIEDKHSLNLSLDDFYIKYGECD